ncbi:hypothetical protein [Pelagerythrobacter sp.]|uniref:hypothetical protein n=1 Tax=Pelagerythrobacter sp. TaxID=2800702 RepID=UPI0035B2B8DC
MPALQIGRASDILPKAAEAAARTGVQVDTVDHNRISEAMARILDERLKHFDHGHTFEKDLIQDERFLLQRSARYAGSATEDIQFHRGDWRKIAIRNAARAAALLLAFIETQLERIAQERSENGRQCG